MYVSIIYLHVFKYYMYTSFLFCIYNHGNSSHSSPYKNIYGELSFEIMDILRYLSPHWQLYAALCNCKKKKIPKEPLNDKKSPG